MSDEVKEVEALGGTKRYVPKAPLNKQGKRERRLNFRMRMLIECYISNGGNAAQAARDVGYGDPETAGPHHMKHPAVRALLNQRLKSMGVNQDEVVGSLVTIMRNHTDSADPAMALNALMAATELCRIFGMDWTRRPSARQKAVRAEFRNVKGRL